MKYGKEFQQILDDPSLPPDWKTSAIEYRRVSEGASATTREQTHPIQMLMGS
jgi:hypothetical protein